MPSPTLITRPMSAVTVWASKSLSRSLMTSLICPLSTWCFLPLRSDVRELAPELLQPRAHAGVDEPVSGLQDEASQDARVDADVEPHLPAQPAREVADEPLPVLGAQRHRRRRHGAHSTGLLVLEPVELVRDLA